MREYMKTRRKQNVNTPNVNIDVNAGVNNDVNVNTDVNSNVNTVNVNAVNNVNVNEPVNKVNNERDKEKEINKEIEKKREEIEKIENVKPARARKDSPKVFQKSSPEVQELFAYWQQKLGHVQSILDTKRHARLDWGLKTYGLDACKKAIDGCAASDWHTGRDPRGNGKRYDDIELIFRDAGKVEGFIKNADTFRGPPLAQKTAEGRADFERLVAEADAALTEEIPY
jgi:hypothetical protein